LPLLSGIHRARYRVAGSPSCRLRHPPLSEADPGERFLVLIGEDVQTSGAAFLEQFA